MVAVMDGFIVVDDAGVARIADSRFRVIDIVLEERAYGWTPVQIQDQHPDLPLAAIYAALAYYHAHREDLDANIERRFQKVEEMRAAAGESPLAKRLRAEGRLK